MTKKIDRTETISCRVRWWRVLPANTRRSHHQEKSLSSGVGASGGAPFNVFIW